MKTKL